MRISRIGQSSLNGFLALLIAALGVGVPIQSHWHDDDGAPRVNEPGHGHGLVLVQHEMRLDRAAAPAVAVAPQVLVIPESVEIRVVTDARASDRPIRESRAPPGQGPRAPPI